jgi:peptidoglycan hydrolase-like protein with peptidoglycan-binding domain
MKKYILVLSLVGLFVTSSSALAQVGGDPDPNPTPVDCVALSTNLRYRDRDATTNGQVSTLQDYLQPRGYLNNEPTGFFGLLTFRAVKSFQNANGITPASGYVGPMTRVKIKHLTCDGDETTNSCSIPSFTVTPRSVTSGQPVRINWITSNCTWATLSTLGEVSLLGGRTIYPTVTTGYGLIAGDGNTTRSSDVITVIVNSTPSNNDPVISSVSGPQTLNVNQTGTWSVVASDPSGDPLTYSVDWGDTCPVGALCAVLLSLIAIIE